MEGGIYTQISYLIIAIVQSFDEVDQSFNLEYNCSNTGISEHIWCNKTQCVVRGRSKMYMTALRHAT